MLRIEPISPVHPDAVVLIDALSGALAAITGDPGRSSFDPADVELPRAKFLLAYDEAGRAVGCGAYRPLLAHVAEIKRMYALPGTRGVGAAILARLEADAAEDGYTETWLETRKVNERAVGFYLRNGYEIIPNFGKYAGRMDAVCFAKQMAA